MALVECRYTKGHSSKRCSNQHFALWAFWFRAWGFGLKEVGGFSKPEGSTAFVFPGSGKALNHSIFSIRPAAVSARYACCRACPRKPATPHQSSDQNFLDKTVFKIETSGFSFLQGVHRREPSAPPVRRPGLQGSAERQCSPSPWSPLAQHERRWGDVDKFVNFMLHLEHAIPV